MAVRATVGAGQDSYPLSFNEIIGYTPGTRRGDAKKGMYQHRNGNILVVYSVNPQLVDIEPRANGRKTNRTGITRIGMFMIGTDGNVRLVTCNRGPDGDKNWRKYDGSITLAGNPHVVPGEAAQGGNEFEDDDED